MSYFDRYQSGEHDQVWAELWRLGEAVRAPDTLDDARAVARETMARVRRNVERLLERLPKVGYKTGYAWTSKTQAADIAMQPQPLGPPVDPRVLDQWEQRVGPMALSLRAFYEVVGCVNLVGKASDKYRWPKHSQVDALYVARFDPTGAEIDEGASTTTDEPTILSLFVAPDPGGKVYVNGVGDIFSPVVTRHADGHLIFGGLDLSTLPRFSRQVRDDRFGFVDYLRLAFSRGGFFGLDDATYRPIVTHLCAGLEPL